MDYHARRRKRKKLRGIAEAARKKAQKLAENLGFCSDTLDMMCAHASKILFELLVEAGYDPKFGIYGKEDDEGGHVFIECDEFIIDITATQFRDIRTPNISYDEVVISTTSSNREGFWEANHYADTIDELIDILRKTNWCDSQIPREN